MILFEHRLLFLLLLLPPLLRALLPAFNWQQRAIKTPWFKRLLSFTGNQRSDAIKNATSTPLTAKVGAYLVWAMIITALARPQMLEEPIVHSLPSRDLLLLIDLSGSMETEDFTNQAGEKVERLDAVKEVVDEFLQRREGDRVALIVFGNAAFVQVPFTQDLQACRDLLRDSAVRMAGPRTALGDAIGLGITLFERSEVEERVMIALTDGNDTGSKVEPLVAARIADDSGVVLHMIGVGDPQAAGEEALDEETLSQMASTAKGKYFHANDRTELTQIYSDIEKISTHEIQTESYRPKRELFHYPLAAAFIISLLLHLFIAGANVRQAPSTPETTGGEA